MNGIPFSGIFGRSYYRTPLCSVGAGSTSGLRSGISPLYRKCVNFSASCASLRSCDIRGGGGAMPPSLASVVHTFEAVAGSWGPGSVVIAPTVNRVIG